MADLSHLSDAELEDIANNKGPALKTGEPSLSHLSDAELEALAAKGKPPKILEEEHPEVSGLQRLIPKNFSNSPDATVGYLQKELGPNFEVQNKDGRVILRKKGEHDYRVLDPDIPFSDMLVDLLQNMQAPRHVPEIIKDVGDIGTDVLQGIGTTAATTFGAGLGGLPGAMGMAGAAGAGGEAAREGMGKALGIPQDVDPKQVVEAGLINAAGPAVFGASKAVPGLPGRALNWLGDKVGTPVQAFLTGAAPRTVRTARANYDWLKGMDESGLDDYIKGQGKQDLAKAKDYLRGAGERYAGSVEGATVDTSAAEQQLLDHLGSLYAKQRVNPIYGDDIAQLEGFLAERFPPHHPLPAGALGPAQEVSRELPGPEALDLFQRVKELGRVNSDKARSAGDRLPGGISAGARDLANEGAGAAGTLGDAIDEATGGAFGKAREEYATAKGNTRAVNRAYTAKNQQSPLQNLLSPGNSQLRGQAQKADAAIGTSLVDTADKTRAWTLLNGDDASSSLAAIRNGRIADLLRLLGKPSLAMPSMIDAAAPPFRAAAQSGWLPLLLDLPKDTREKRNGQ